jgi:hypothetical protein
MYIWEGQMYLRRLMSGALDEGAAQYRSAANEYCDSVRPRASSRVIRWRDPLHPGPEERRVFLIMSTRTATRSVVVRFPSLVIGLAGLLLFTVRASAQPSHITSVDPLTVKVGAVVSAKGEGIGPAIVDELYLTNTEQDVKVDIINQTEKLITFKVPVGLKPGRWALMIHLKAGNGTRFFEQPIKVTVE